MIRCILFSAFLLMFFTIDASGKAEIEREQCAYTEYNTVDELFAQEFCCLCKDCDYPPTERIGWFVNSNNKTCKDYYSEFMNQIPKLSDYCHEMQNHLRDTCCNLTCEPKKISQRWEPAAYPYEQGPEPSCNLCKYDQYPTKPYIVTSVSAISGNPTCEDLYWMGRTGNIPDHICQLTQTHMHEPCGCAKPADPPVGMEPYCHICSNAHYPIRPNIRINELPGTPSCKKLYWQGRAGQLTPDLCDHIREKNQKPCGCVIN